MSLRGLKVGLTAAIAVLLLTCGGALFAQDKPLSKVDVFAGYAWLHPGGQVSGRNLGDMPAGFGTSTTYYFNNYFGGTIDAGVHSGENNKIFTLMLGPTVRFGNHNGVIPFGHALVGLHKLDLTGGFRSSNGIGAAAGGGLDLVTKFPRLNIRLIEADMLYGHHALPPAPFNRVDNIGARLRTGLVFNFGQMGPPPAPPTASCSAQPTEVFEGEPVTITATGNGFNPKKTVAYEWSGTGVKVGGTGNTVNIDTKGMQPGSYPVKATLRESPKRFAECTANVVIKQPRPPQVSCAINPNVIQTGDGANVTASASSPDGRPLTYSYKTTGGTIEGSGPSARFSSQGMQPGSATVTCGVSDDRNLTASDTANVTVNAPPPPPPPPAPPEAAKLNDIQFPKRLSGRVDNAAKAILDDVALRLQRDADAKAVIVGQVNANEKDRKLAAQRATNAKTYLVKEKGIDPARIEVRTGKTSEASAGIWIVPAGATYNDPNTEVVKEAVAKAKTKSKK